MLGVAADRRDVRRCSGSFRYARLVSSSWRYVQPSSPSRADLLAVGGDEVAPERVEVRVDVLVDRRPPAAVVDHARRRDRQLRRRRRHRVLQEAEIVAEDRLREPTLPVDVQRGGVNSTSPSSLWKRTVIARPRSDPVELVDEVHVPGAAAKLAVGGRLEAGVLLQPTASRIASSSAARSAGASSSPRGERSRARSSSGGRSRLPTWSARKGGFVLRTREPYGADSGRPRRRRLRASLPHQAVGTR